MAEEDGTRNDAVRLIRDGGDRGPSLAERIGERLDGIAYAMPWHRLRLKGRFPPKLLGFAVDPLPGDAAAGESLSSGMLAFAGHRGRIADMALDDPSLPPAFAEWLHGWSWLRDLKAASLTDATAAVALSRRWLNRFHHYDARAWAPAVTGRRIMLAAAHAPLVMPAADHIHRSAVLNGIARWARQLDRSAPRVIDGYGRAEALAGLIAAALVLPGGDHRLKRGETLLCDLLDTILNPDGSAVSRSPRELATLGELLLFLSEFYAARGVPAPDWLAGRRAAIAAALSGLAMGNGVPAPWHGGAPDAGMMERCGVAFADPAPGRDSGFQRLAAGDSILVIDAGPPPPARISETGHASTLAMAMSDGPHLLFTSCGAGDGLDLPPDIRRGLRSTAAHSTLVLADTNSTRLADGGPRRGGGVTEVVAEMRFSPQGQWLEARHDGYRRRFGYGHMRRLYLSPGGDDLRGEEQLIPARDISSGGAKLPVAVRFHLDPGWNAETMADGAIRLALKAGNWPEWLFRASFNTAPGRIAIEPGIIVDADGGLRESLQILLATTVDGGRASIGWSVRRQA